MSFLPALLRYLRAIFFFVLAFLSSHAVAVDIPETGYRGIPYAAPTPQSVPGGTTLFFAEDVVDLISRQDVLLVNVAPTTITPPDDEGERQWVPREDKPAQQIPGSIWLPNVGYQTLEADMQRYLVNNLAFHTGNNKAYPILFYCTSDCWMSWNSVKRASEELGYSSLYWYPYGIDGWREDDLPLEPSIPIPFSTAATTSND